MTQTFNAAGASSRPRRRQGTCKAPARDGERGVSMGPSASSGATRARGTIHDGRTQGDDHVVVMHGTPAAAAGAVRFDEKEGTVPPGSRRRWSKDGRPPDTGRKLALVAAVLASIVLAAASAHAVDDGAAGATEHAAGFSSAASSADAEGGADDDEMLRDGGLLSAGGGQFDAWRLFLDSEGREQSSVEGGAHALGLPRRRPRRAATEHAAYGDATSDTADDMRGAGASSSEPWPLQTDLPSAMSLRSLVYDRFSGGVGPHRYFRLDHSRRDMRCPSTLCRAFEFFKMRETKADVNYDIYWGVFDKNGERLRTVANRIKYKKTVTFREQGEDDAEDAAREKLVTIEQRKAEHIIRFAIPWIPGLDGMLGKKDSLARTQRFCLEHTSQLVAPSDCYFSSPSFVVTETYESWKEKHEELSRRYGRPAPWIMKPSDGYFSSGIFILSTTELPTAISYKKPMPSSRAPDGVSASSKARNDGGEVEGNHVSDFDSNIGGDWSTVGPPAPPVPPVPPVPPAPTVPPAPPVPPLPPVSDPLRESARPTDDETDAPLTGRRTLAQYARAEPLPPRAAAPADVARDEARPVHTPILVAQEYIHNPLLWRGRKFDFRFNVVVTSISPSLRVHFPRFGFIKMGVAPYEDDMLSKAKSLLSPSSIDMCKHITTATDTCMNYATSRPREVYKGSVYGTTFEKFARGLPVYTDDAARFLQHIQWSRRMVARTIAKVFPSMVPPPPSRSVVDADVGDTATGVDADDVRWLDSLTMGKNVTRTVSGLLWDEAWDACKRAAFDAVKIAVWKMQSAPTLDEEEAELRASLSKLKQFGVLGFDGIVNEHGQCFVEEVNLNGSIVDNSRLPRILDLIKDEIRLSGKYNERQAATFARVRPSEVSEAVLEYCQDRLRVAGGMEPAFVHPVYQHFIPVTVCDKAEVLKMLDVYDETTAARRSFQYVAVITPSEQTLLEYAYTDAADGRQVVLQAIRELRGASDSLEGQRRAVLASTTEEAGDDGRAPGGEDDDDGVADGGSSSQTLSSSERDALHGILRRMVEASMLFPETMAESIFMMHTRTRGLTT